LHVAPSESAQRGFLIARLPQALIITPKELDSPAEWRPGKADFAAILGPALRY
jgi:hypothetical protein